MENKNLTLALEGSIIKWLIILAIPILIWNLLQSAYQFVDAYWVWSISKEAVAAVSVSWPVIFLIIALGTGFSMAWSILIAQYSWQKNKEMVNHCSAQTLLIDIIISIILWAIWYFNSENILRLIWVEENVMVQAVDFMQITFIWLIFMFIFSMFQSIMRWIWEVKLPMYIIAGTVVLNFIIDPMFILGFWPIPAMWVKWAAIATMITQAISAIIWLFILFKWNYWIKVHLKDFKPDFWFIKKIFFLWFPSSLEMSVRAFWFVMLTTLITSFWTIAVAAYWAWANIYQLVLIPTIWLSIATSTMVWQNLWAKKLERAQKIAKVSAVIAFCVLETIWLFVFIFAENLIWLFIHNDAEVIKIWVDLLKISAFTFWTMWVQFALTWVFRAAWNMMLALVLGIISMFMIQFPIAYLLSKQTDLWIDWVWLSFPITNIVMVTICILIYLKWDWKNKSIVWQTKEELEEEKAQESIEENIIFRK